MGVDLNGDDDDEDGGPLRLIRLALPWSAFRCHEDLVQIMYPHSSDAGVLSEVVLSEGCDVVAITLFRRAVVGTHPDGSISGERCDLQHSAVSVALARPLGDRKLIDGATGEPGQLFSPDEPSWTKCVQRDGCPRWVP